jgi:hypothetical protein
VLVRCVRVYVLLESVFVGEAVADENANNAGGQLDDSFGA